MNSEIKESLDNCTLPASARSCELRGCDKCGWQKDKANEIRRRLKIYGLIKGYDGRYRIATRFQDGNRLLKQG